VVLDVAVVHFAKRLFEMWFGSVATLHKILGITAHALYGVLTVAVTGIFDPPTLPNVVNLQFGFAHKNILCRDGPTVQTVSCRIYICNCKMLLIVIIVAALFATIVEGYYECQPGTVVLDLTNTYLGTFPNVSTCATTLQKLYLSGTGLSGIPPEIGELGSLLELRVEGNQLTALPREVGSLSNLRDMWASGNSISELPSTFSDLMLLRTLRLSRNSFPVVPPAIFNLNLQELYMDSNPLTTVPPELGNMHNLVGATFSYNPVSSLPAELGGWWSLEWLQLWGTSVQCLPRSMTKLPKFVNGNYYPTCTNDNIAGYVVQRVRNKNTCSGTGNTSASP
jgi:Leucine-rich repeat (LRR) protein